MAAPVVFYAWQNDRPRETTRDFIHQAADEAIRHVGTGMRVEDSPRLDHDTKDEAGSPAIAETILRKIKHGKNPPNAALSVYERGQKDSTLCVVELTNPVVEGADLVYNYKLINGKMPATGGATSLFIDWIGRGGGVGFGYHGVGVGRRGFGLR